MSEAFSKVSVLTSRLHELVSEHPDFEVLGAPAFSGYCFRYMPNSLADRREEPEVQGLLDDLNEQIVAAIRRNGQAPVVTTRILDRVAIRMPNHSSEKFTEDIDTAFEVIARWGRLLSEIAVQNQTTANMEAELCLSESHSSSTEVSAT